VEEAEEEVDQYWHATCHSENMDLQTVTVYDDHPTHCITHLSNVMHTTQVL